MKVSDVTEPSGGDQETDRDARRDLSPGALERRMRERKDDQRR
jgi:hypothetical protein